MNSPLLCTSLSTVHCTVHYFVYCSLYCALFCVLFTVLCTVSLCTLLLSFLCNVGCTLPGWLWCRGSLAWRIGSPGSPGLTGSAQAGGRSTLSQPFKMSQYLNLQAPPWKHFGVQIFCVFQNSTLCQESQTFNCFFFVFLLQFFTFFHFFFSLK